MITPVVQRWQSGRASYRPAGEPINPRLYDVAVTDSDRVARTFVEQHHYARSYPAARFRVALYERHELVGLAVLSQPASQAALDAALPYPNANRAELGRFVLLDRVPANGETWFLARALELARRHGFDAIVSHADPEPRFAAGERVFPGHVGTIYQAANATYVGRTPPRSRRMFADGTVLSARAESKLRCRERGWEYVVEQLVAHGAPAPSGEWDAWRRAAVASTTRTVRHGGNHRYLFALDRALRAALPAPQRFPKVTLSTTSNQLNLEFTP